MSKGWTQERRQKQAERCRQNRPWENSTGPKTPGGKKRSSMNAHKHGMNAASTRALKRALALNKIFLKNVMAWNILSAQEKRLQNEVINKLKETTQNQCPEIATPRPAGFSPKRTEDGIPTSL